MHNSLYIGRFAPSPTGSLHLGSLLAAMASYCEAMQHNGQWLVRIEDLDPPREIQGASKQIISTLRLLGFKFEQKVIFQSHNTRQLVYQQALEFLTKNNYTYNCSCSRAELKTTTIQSHKCRNNTIKSNKPYNIRLRVPELPIKFIDKIQGQYTKHLQSECGDFVLKRKDGLFAYQLAVVVDDNFQKITDIIRGIDLIESTSWQIYLNHLLNFKQPNYGHIPILINQQGQKLSKQTFAQEIDNLEPINTLITAYNYLKQKPCIKQPQSISEFWSQAISNWNINKIAKVRVIKV